MSRIHDTVQQIVNKLRQAEVEPVKSHAIAHARQGGPCRDQIRARVVSSR